MDVVPANAPLMVTVMLRPEDVDNVMWAMDARVRLSGLTSGGTRRCPPRLR